MIVPPEERGKKRIRTSTNGEGKSYAERVTLLIISPRANLFYYSDAAEICSVNNDLLLRSRHLRPAHFQFLSRLSRAAGDNGLLAWLLVKNPSRVPQITVCFDTNAGPTTRARTLYPVKVITGKSMSPGWSDMLLRPPWQFKYPVNKDNATEEVDVICNTHCSVRSLPLYYGLTQIPIQPRQCERTATHSSAASSLQPVESDTLTPFSISTPGKDRLLAKHENRIFKRLIGSRKSFHYCSPVSIRTDRAFCCHPSAAFQLELFLTTKLVRLSKSEKMQLQHNQNQSFTLVH